MDNFSAITAQQIFTGNTILNDVVLEIKDNIVQSITPKENYKKNDIKDFGDTLIAPAFIDIQLYGAHGRLLSAYPDAATVAAIYDYSANGGACLCIPTVATQTYDVIFKSVDAIKAYWKQGGKGVVGLHVEGPWISKEKRGAHNADWIFSPTIQQAKELLEYGKDVIKIITLAPEVCNKEIIELIQLYNIVVSAGHSSASYEQATEVFDSNIQVATHLYNAMSGLQHRNPGMVGAIFNHANVRCSLVPDGHHVSFSAIQIAKKIMGNRLFAITDAVTETHTGYYQHVEADDMYTANGILSGSALTMQKALYRLVNYAGIDVEETLRMCSLYPAQVMHLNNFGVIEKDKPLNAVVLNNNLEITDRIFLSN